MSIGNGPLFTDPAHMSALKSGARTGSTDNLREVARQFESLFTHMLMKNMRAASLGEGVMDNDQSKFYQDMFDQQMSTELSRGQGLGIAQLLFRQLGGMEEPAAMPANGDQTAINSGPKAGDGVGATQHSSMAQSPLEFIQSALPHARRIGKALGIAPRLILAQAALESGWGARPIRNEDGSSSHNLFGIKAGSGWSGGHAVVSTLEFASGIGRRVSAAFRAYGSMGESFDDYARLLQDSSRYQGVLNTGDNAAAFAGALSRGGYATDPDYATKIMDIADGKTLTNALAVTDEDHNL